MRTTTITHRLVAKTMRLLAGSALLLALVEPVAWASHEGGPSGVSSAVKVADVQVTGLVTDENNMPLPGVSVLVKGSARGANTNANGTYTILVPNGNATLVFSFVGYLNREVAVGSQTQINVQLQTDTKSLNEVVVVGYGTQK